MFNSKGFTIIELLVAMTILAIVLLGLLGGFINIYRYNLNNMLRDEAVLIAQETFEEFRNDNITEIISEFQDTVCNPDDNSTGSHRVIRQLRNKNFAFGRQLELLSPSPVDVAPVRVTVCWKNHGRLMSQTFETIIQGK